MEVLNVKIEDQILDEMDEALKKHRYSTRSEFVRDAIREKLSELENAELLRKVVSARGASKHKTTDAQLHKARDKVAEMLEKRFR